eukprot:3261397-Pyramimonas_sp.AAC.1
MCIRDSHRGLHPRPARHTQYSVSWPHRELHLRPQWGWPRASATPSAAFRGPIGSSTEGPSGGGHMRPPRPVQLLNLLLIRCALGSS